MLPWPAQDMQHTLGHGRARPARSESAVEILQELAVFPYICQLALPRRCASAAITVQRHRGNHLWSYDFLATDELTRTCLAIEAGRTFTSRDVFMTRQYLYAVRKALAHLRSDDRQKFVAEKIQNWLSRYGVSKLCTNTSGPWGDGYVGSFNDKLRDERLNRESHIGFDEDSL